MSERSYGRRESSGPPEHRQFSTPDGDSSDEFSRSEESSSISTQHPMYRRDLVSVIAIGNPGAGKSTILNSLAGEVLFKSGISIGDGLTYQLDQKKNSKGTFFDTPGLADDTKREGASKAISTALRKGGPFKILFFVRLDNGRIIVEDKTTMKVVLDSAPEIGKKYGIVTNKIQKEVIQRLQKPGNAEHLVIKLMADIPEENKCDPASITYLPYKTEADAKDNHLLHSSSLMTTENSSIVDFVYDQIETVQLTKGQAKDIDIGYFDDTTEHLKRLQKEMDTNTEMFQDEQKKMHNWMEKAEREKEQMMDLMREQYQQDMSREKSRKEKLEQFDQMRERGRINRQQKQEQCIVM